MPITKIELDLIVKKAKNKTKADKNRQTREKNKHCTLAWMMKKEEKKKKVKDGFIHR